MKECNICEQITEEEVLNFWESPTIRIGTSELFAIAEDLVKTKQPKLAYEKFIRTINTTKNETDRARFLYQKIEELK